MVLLANIPPLGPDLQALWLVAAGPIPTPNSPDPDPTYAQVVGDISASVAALTVNPVEKPLSKMATSGDRGDGGDAASKQLETRTATPMAPVNPGIIPSTEDVNMEDQVGLEEGELGGDVPPQVATLRRELAEARAQIATMAVQRVHVTSPSSKIPSGIKPPHFSGKVKDDGLDIRGWLTMMKQYCELTEVAPDKEASVVSLYLDGSARNMVNARLQAQKVMEPNFVFSMPWLSELLLSAYGSVDPIGLAWQKLEKLRQGSLSVEEYATQFEQVCAELGNETPNEATKIMKFKAGLNSDIRFRCAARPDGQRWTNYQDLVRCCSLNWGVMQEQKADRAVPQHPKGNSNSASSAAKAPGAQATTNFKKKKGKTFPYKKKTTDKNNGSGLSIPKAEVKRLMGEGRCLYCKEKGHFARDCPTNPKSGGSVGGSADGKQPKA